SVVDAEGKVILEKNNLSNGALMNLGNVAPGVYLVNISSENEVQTIRIVKN
ncbi:MAG: T9SS C-terminal target domain-containing protein, partial [Crocinitomicaceae bacterium]|nr:T9SS C-terminal target domain-containing protein [Crocinitomicaceae bacterium]